MSLSDELRDPWAAVVAATAGGLTWALAAGTPAAAALGVGVAGLVYGAKAVTGLVVHRGGPDATRSRLRSPRSGTPAAYWFARAQRAVSSIEELAASMTRGPTWAALRDTSTEAATTLAALSRLAGQVGAVEAAERRVDAASLGREAARLAVQERRTPPGPVQAEVTRAMAAVRDQLAVADRLSGAREGLLARMQSATIGLEGLVARLAEVLALAESVGGVDTLSEQIADLAAELDGLRTGLAETEAVSQRALRAAADPKTPS